MSRNCYVALPGPRAGPIAPGALVKELHLVGLTADRDGLIFAARKGGKSGGFKIVLDEDLLDHIDELRAELGLAVPAAPRPRSAPRRMRSALSPREIQARLRVGATLEEVAGEAGVDVSWVERFAVPVLAEQNDAIDRATRLTVTTPRRGTSDRPLIDAVTLNLADRGVRLPESAADAGWSAHHRHGSQWNLRFTFRQRGREMRAEWRADLAEGTLVCENRLAADLGFTGPGGSHPARPDAHDHAEELAETRAVSAARQVSTTGLSRRAQAPPVAAAARATPPRVTPPRAKAAPAARAGATKARATKAGATKAGATKAGAAEGRRHEGRRHEGQGHQGRRGQGRRGQGRCDQGRRGEGQDDEDQGRRGQGGVGSGGARGRAPGPPAAPGEHRSEGGGHQAGGPAEGGGQEGGRARAGAAAQGGAGPEGGGQEGRHSGPGGGQEGRRPGAGGPPEGGAGREDVGEEAGPAAGGGGQEGGGPGEGGGQEGGPTGEGGGQARRGQDPGCGQEGRRPGAGGGEEGGRPGAGRGQEGGRPEAGCNPKERRCPSPGGLAARRGAARRGGGGHRASGRPSKPRSRRQRRSTDRPRRQPPTPWSPAVGSAGSRGRPCAGTAGPDRSGVATSGPLRPRRSVAGLVPVPGQPSSSRQSTAGTGGAARSLRDSAAPDGARTGGSGAAASRSDPRRVGWRAAPGLGTRTHVGPGRAAARPGAGAAGVALDASRAAPCRTAPARCGPPPPPPPLLPPPPAPGTVPARPPVTPPLPRPAAPAPPPPAPAPQPVASGIDPVETSEDRETQERWARLTAAEVGEPSGSGRRRRSRVFRDNDRPRRPLRSTQEANAVAARRKEQITGTSSGPDATTPEPAEPSAPTAAAAPAPAGDAPSGSTPTIRASRAGAAGEEHAPSRSTDASDERNGSTRDSVPTSAGATASVPARVRQRLGRLPADRLGQRDGARR